jgi:4'-phosphopantetheinyl transferase
MKTHAHEVAELRLESHEVHVWWRRVDAGHFLDDTRGWLSDEERRRGERFRREEDARAFVARRLFLRGTLARYLGRPPGALCFTEGPHGKPSLVDSGGIEFSLSRAGAWALLGVARGRALGVDVERLDARLEEAEELSRLAARVLTPGESAELEARAPEARAGAFLQLWARKEALLKALGTGLSLEPDTVEVGLEGLGPLASRSVGHELFPRGGAELVDLLAPAGYVASVVAEGARWELAVCNRAA